MKIYILIGTRPNFIKVTQFKRVAKMHDNVDIQIIHTGQHYDHQMADVFFDQFKMRPDHFLNVPAGTPNDQIAEIMVRLEKLINEIGAPDVLLVPGDVNSTLAGAVTANKMGIKLGHIEAGLRSYDKTMPEEVNRILVDHLSDYYFVTEQSGLDHIEKENLSGKAFYVGNTMIDTLLGFREETEASNVLEENNLTKHNFVLMTMHRPATVDSKDGLEELLDLLESVTKRYKILFPIHPRTKSNLEKFGLIDQFNELEGLILGGPMDYFAFQKAVRYAKVIITDSGGIQEETTAVKVPCLTLRANTERPSTLEIGSNTLVEFDKEIIGKLLTDIENGDYKKGEVPELWDGKATERIVEALLKN